MVANEHKVTTFSSITLIILKELRLERGVHQAQIADMCDKTPSAWTKIETGKSPLSMEVFFRVCNGLQVPFSSVLATTERYTTLLSQNGWAIISKQLDFSEDLLLKEAQEYYSSAGYRSRGQVHSWNFNSVLSSPKQNFDGTITPSPVFWFVLDPGFKAQQLNYKAPLNFDHGDNLQKL